MHNAAWLCESMNRRCRCIRWQIVQMLKTSVLDSRADLVEEGEVVLHESRGRQVLGAANEGAVGSCLEEGRIMCSAAGRAVRRFRALPDIPPVVTLCVTYQGDVVCSRS